MKTHRPLVWMTLFYAAGIAASQMINLPFNWLCILSIIFLLAILLIRNSVIAMIIVWLTFILIGAIYTQSRQLLAHDHVANISKYLRHQPVAVDGIIVSQVQARNFFKGTKRTFTLEVKRVQTLQGWQDKSGEILVNTFGNVDLFYGDRIVLEGKLYQPYNFSQSEHFSYGDYLKNQGIELILSVKKQTPIKIIEHNQGNILMIASLKLKDRLKKLLSDHLSYNEAGIMHAFLLGDRSHIPKHINNLFVQTGTVHILAISGLNVGVIMTIFLMLFRMIPLDRRVQLAVTIIFLTWFTLLTGSSPSVVRSTIMSSVFLMSLIFERDTDSLNTLFLAALIILIINPLNLFDVGFQLSFACVLSIILFYPMVQKVFLKMPNLAANRLGRHLIESLSLSLAVWVAVAGLILYYFAIITPITVIANLIVIPLSSVLIILGASLLMVGSFWPSSVIIFASCIKVVLNFMVGTIYLFSKVPCAYFYISNLTFWYIWIYYGILAIIFYFCLKEGFLIIDKEKGV